MSEKTTLKVADDGRTTIPLAVREKLGVKGEKFFASVEITDAEVQ